MTLWVSGDALLSVSQTSKMQSGYMLSSRFSWEKLKQLSLDAFAAVFSTKADNRFYAYEPQLSYTGAFPSFFIAVFVLLVNAVGNHLTSCKSLHVSASCIILIKTV